jgi:hypothetical protein
MERKRNVTVATYVGIAQQDGQIHLAEPVDLPEGSLVYVIVPPVVDEQTACRQANRWLLEHVGDMVMADQPIFTWNGERAVWRCGAFVTALRRQPQGPIGHVDVDVSTGQVLADDTNAQEMIARGKQVEFNSLPAGG